MGTPSSKSPCLVALILAAAASSADPSVCADVADGQCLDDDNAAAAATTADGGVRDGGDNTCLLYIAQSTIPGAGIGMFAGVSFEKGTLLGRGYGDPAIPSVDQDWHNSPSASGSLSKSEGDYHWALTSYDWNANAIGNGMAHEGEDISVTATGFGATPNCHFNLNNVEEHTATYDTTNMDRYTSPGAGASTPYFNRTSTAIRNLAEGSELFVNYGEQWFEGRPVDFSLVPLEENFEAAQEFLNEYGKMLTGHYEVKDDDEEKESGKESSEEWQKQLTEENMILSNTAQKDLWDLIKDFSYKSRGQSALPSFHANAIRAIHADIQTVEVENSIRPIEELQARGKCLDNIVPGTSTISDAGRGAFATRFIPRGGLVAPAPVVHIVDRSTVNMYEEMIGPNGNVVRNESAPVPEQMHLNYCFGHPESTVLLFPYSSNVAYINHHRTDYNAEIRWTEDFDFFHHKEWLNKSVEFLEEQWTAGMMLEFIATRDIQPNEEVFIDYGLAWDKAWRRHVDNWVPLSPEKDSMGKYTVFDLSNHPGFDTPAGNIPFLRAEVLNKDHETPIKTENEERIDHYPYNIESWCFVNTDLNDTDYIFAPETVPYFKREWAESIDYTSDEDKYKCTIKERYDKPYDYTDSDDEDEEKGPNSHLHPYLYSVEVRVQKQVESSTIFEVHSVWNVPWMAIRFENIHYTSDVFLKGAFRHDMMLPDAVFPKAWMNLKGQKVGEDN